MEKRIPALGGFDPRRIKEALGLSGVVLMLCGVARVAGAPPGAGLMTGIKTPSKPGGSRVKDVRRAASMPDAALLGLERRASAPVGRKARLDTLLLGGERVVRVGRDVGLDVGRGRADAGLDGGDGGDAEAHDSRGQHDPVNRHSTVFVFCESLEEVHHGLVPPKDQWFRFHIHSGLDPPVFMVRHRRGVMPYGPRIRARFGRQCSDFRDLEKFSQKRCKYLKTIVINTPIVSKYSFYVQNLTKIAQSSLILRNDSGHPAGLLAS